MGYKAIEAPRGRCPGCKVVQPVHGDGACYATWHERGRTVAASSSRMVWWIERTGTDARGGYEVPIGPFKTRDLARIALIELQRRAYERAREERAEAEIAAIEEEAAQERAIAERKAKGEADARRWEEDRAAAAVATGFAAAEAEAKRLFDGLSLADRGRLLDALVLHFHHGERAREDREIEARGEAAARATSAARQFHDGYEAAQRALASIPVEERGEAFEGLAFHFNIGDARERNRKAQEQKWQDDARARSQAFFAADEKVSS